MRHLLGLLLALVAPAQASIHYDGFEARMPVSDWVQIIGPKDGTAKQTVAVPISGTGLELEFGSGAPPMSISDFQTTPQVITGVEIRLSILASHPGISIARVDTDSFWSHTFLPEAERLFYGVSALSTPAFDVGTPTDLSGHGYISVGGFLGIAGDIRPEYFAIGLDFDANDPDWWTTDTITLPSEIELFRGSDRFTINFVSNDGYAANLYIDSIDYRLHYEDASTAAMSGGGTMAVTLQKAMPISAGMSGSGSVAATMNAERVISAAMSGSGRIDPVLTRDSGGTIYRYLMPELSGGGTMSVTPLIRYAPVPAAMSGGGTMSATLQRGHGIKASSPLAMSAVGTLAYDLAAQRPISSAMNGAGVLAASMVARRPIQASLSGSVAMTASLGANRPVAAAMSGSGALAATIQRILGSQPVGASMAGAGSMAVDLIAHRPVAAAMTGAGTVNADGLTINTRLAAPEGRSFYAADDAMAFIAPDDFLTFEAQE